MSASVGPLFAPAGVVEIQPAETPGTTGHSGMRRARSGDRVPAWLARAAALGWRMLVVGALVYVALSILARLRIVFVPLLVALFATAILRPLMRLLARRLPRSVAAGLATFLLVGVLGGVIAVVAVVVAGEQAAIGAAISSGWSDLEGWLRGRSIAGIPLWQTIQSSVDSLRDQSATAARLAATGALRGAMFLSELILTVAFVFFLLRDGERLVRRALDLLPPDRRAHLRTLGGRMWNGLERYLRGISITAVANSLLKGLALISIGIPFVLPIMFITFVGSFIPYAGPIVATIIGALVALSHGGPIDALLIIGAGVVIEIIEGNVLHPLVVGRTVQLPALIILFAVTTGASLWGLIGAFIAVPVTASLLVLAESIRDARRPSPLMQ